MSGNIDRSPNSLESRRAALEFFFWVWQQSVKHFVLTVLAIYALVALVEGRSPGLDQLLDAISRLR